MPRMSFNTFGLKRALEHPPAAKDGAVVQVDYTDESMKGFMLRVSSTGAASWQFVMRLRDGSNKLRRFTIGRAGAGGMTLEDARAEARRLRKLIERREDPKALSEAAEQEREARQAKTFGVVAALYMEKKLVSLRTRDELQRILNKDILPRWKDIPVFDIKRSHLVDLRDAIAERAPIMGSRVASLAYTVLRWYAGRDENYREPVLPDDFWPEEKARERTLDDRELRKLWPLWEREPLLGPLCQLILLTAQRPGNVQEMQWSEIDEENALWIIPRGKFKTDTEQVVPLSDAALAIIKAQKPHPRGDYVLTSMGDRPYKAYMHRKPGLDARAGVTGYTLHDLRRTARSLMSRPLEHDGHGIPPDIAERVLGHAMGRIRGVYDRHAYTREKRLAVNHIAAQVAKIVAPTLALPAPM